jgi:hypothetical protein
MSVLNCPVVGRPLSFQLKVIPLNSFVGNGFVEFSVRECFEEEGNTEDTDCFLQFLRFAN